MQARLASMRQTENIELLTDTIKASLVLRVLVTLLTTVTSAGQGFVYPTFSFLAYLYEI